MHPSWNDYPHLVAELDPDGNKDLTRYGKPVSLLDLSVGTSKKLDWKCSTCEHEWSASGDNRSGKKRGCPACGRKRSGDSRRLTFDDFKRRTEIACGEGILDFSQAVYVNNGTKVKLRHIPCDHWFENRPQKLMIGQLGCPKCRYNRAGESHPQKKSTEQWIAEARETHGDLYIYHSEYTNNKGMMDIECTICDTKFSQEAKSHATYGQGCPKCRYVKSAAGIRLNFDEILKRLETRRQETGKHYRYPNLTAETYTSASHKYEIVCPDCNRTFQQTLAKHIDRRQGCGACSTTGFQPDQLGYYYVHKILNESGDILMYKGGISGNWQQRLQTLRRGIPDHLTMELHEVIEFEIGQEALDLETTLLRMAAEEGWKAPSRKFDGGCELFLENPLDHARSHVLI